MKYLTVAEVAKHFSVSTDTVRRWIKIKRLKPVNISTGKRPTYRILESDLEQIFWIPTAEPEIEFQFIKSKMGKSQSPAKLSRIRKVK